MGEIPAPGLLLSGFGVEPEALPSEPLGSSPLQTSVTGDWEPELKSKPRKHRLFSETFKTPFQGSMRTPMGFRHFCLRGLLPS